MFDAFRVGVKHSLAVPNQRKAGLKMLGAWLPEEEIAFLKKQAHAQGVTVTDIIRAAIERLEAEAKTDSKNAKRKP